MRSHLWLIRTVLSFYSNLYCALKPPVYLLYLFYCLGQWLDFNGAEHKWNSREEKVAILSGRLKICTVYCSFVCFLFVSFLPLLVVFVSCLCLLVATLPMAGWADPLDCRWWKTIKTWPIHWEQSFAYPGIYKHLKTNICLFALSIKHVMCWVGWYSSIGLLQSTIYAAKILLFYLWQKDLCCQVPTYLTEFYTPSMLLHGSILSYIKSGKCYKHVVTQLVIHGTFFSLWFSRLKVKNTQKDTLLVYLVCSPPLPGAVGGPGAKRGPDKLYAQTFPPTNLLCLLNK